MKGIYEYLLERNRKSPNKILFFSEKESYTYSQSLSCVETYAKKLFDAGINSFSKVALRATRNIKSSFIYFALQALGATTYLIDPHEKILDFVSENEDYFNDVDFFLTSEEDEFSLSNGEKWSIARKDYKFSPINLSFGSSSLSWRDKLLSFSNPSKGSIIIFTSGSEGRSKGVIQSQQAFLDNGTDTYPIGGYRKDDKAILLIPINHVFGLALLSLSPELDYSVFFPSKLDTLSLAKAIERYRITRLNAVPTLLLELLRVQNETHLDLSSLRCCLIGGGACPKKQMEEIEKGLGVTLIPVYGMSECIGISCSSIHERSEDKNSNVGKPYPSTKVKFLSDGEIIVKGPALFKGYLNQKESPFDEEGYLHTGDLGYLDEKGHLVISGRKKDLINRGGEKISSARIEAILSSLPYIKECAVLPKKDDKFGEVPFAFVSLKENVEKEDIINDLKKSLKKIELPTGISIIDELPKTFSMKIDKQKLKETL